MNTPVIDLTTDEILFVTEEELLQWPLFDLNVTMEHNRENWRLYNQICPHTSLAWYQSIK